MIQKGVPGKWLESFLRFLKSKCSFTTEDMGAMVGEEGCVLGGGKKRFNMGSDSTMEPKRVDSGATESEQRYKRLLAATTDYVFSVDFNHGINSTTHGPGCESVTGYSPAEFASDPYLWYRVIHDEDRQNVMAQINLILNNHIPSKPLEHRIVHKDGSIRWIRNTTIPHRNNDEKITGYDGLITDITERKQIEQTLHEANVFLDSVVENIPIGVFIKDAEDLRFIRINKSEEALLGWSRDEMVGRNDYDLFPKPEADFFTAKDREVLASGQLLNIPEEQIKLKDGSFRIIHTIKIPVRDGNSQKYLLGISEDITERKQAEEQLRLMNTKLMRRGEELKKLVRQLNASHRELRETQLELIQAAKLESVGTLTAGVAHEVQNPLQIILLGLDYLANRLANPDESLALILTDMRDAVNRANSIIRELLNLTTNSNFQMISQDLNQLIARALLLVKNPLTSQQVEVRLELDPSLPALKFDAQKLEQVFINVFINSIQAMAAGGTLTIRTRQVLLDDSSAREPVFRRFNPGETLVVAEVQDTGSGLTETEIARAFDPFFTTKPVGVGSGLGLPVARKIIDVHGGNIEIKNAPGGGALVAIVLKT